MNDRSRKNERGGSKRKFRVPSDVVGVQEHDVPHEACHVRSEADRLVVPLQERDGRGDGGGQAGQTGRGTQVSEGGGGGQGVLKLRVRTFD